MKKFISYIIVLIVFLMPLGVSADGTKRFYTNIDILENGDIKVRELVELDGDYNGLQRQIEFMNTEADTFTGKVSDLQGSSIYNGSSISDLKISSISKSNFSFDIMNNITNYFTQVSGANRGNSGVFTRQDHTSGIDLMIFNPSSNNTAFYIEYIVKDVIVVHNDIAELAWNTLGTGYTENIDDYQIKVNLPSEDTDLRVWLHGPLNGLINRVDYKTALATYDFLGAYNAVSVRLLFNKNLVSGATKFSGMTAKSDIIAYQTTLANYADQQREKIKKENEMIISASIVYLAVLVVLVLICYLKSWHSKKTDFQMEYYRDFPGEYGPEVLEFLLSKNVTENSLSATILNLIYKKVLKAEEIEDEKHKNKDFKLTYIDKTKELTVPEKMAIEMFINEVGDGTSVMLGEVRRYGLIATNAESFIRSYDNFKSLSKELGRYEEFFSKGGSLATLTTVIGVLGIPVSIFSFMKEVGFIPSYLAFIIGIIAAVFVSNLKFYTPKGALHHKQWMAHKKFLKDFGRMDEKELPEVVLWDKYLVYATVLGCAYELQKQMKLKIENMDNATLSTYNPYMTNYYVRTSIYQSVNQSVNRAVSSSRSSIASSHMSSGDGFGGGAIGGGGSFGGGGGGGRF